MKYFIYILIVVSSLTCIGQDVTFVSDFELVEVEGGVFVNWQIDSGYTCQGVDILRSIDGVEFKEIGHISGVCGSLSKPTPYSYLDESPVPNVSNYYQLKINGFGFTEVLELYYLIVPKSGVLIYPNPSEGRIVNIKFDNPNSEEVVIQLLDSKGRIVKEIETLNNEILLVADVMLRGMYFVRLIENKGKAYLVTKLSIN